MRPLLISILLLMAPLAHAKMPNGRASGAQINALTEMIQAAENAGDLLRAEQLAREQLTTAAGGPPRWAGNASRRLAHILLQRGRLNEAELFLRKAAPLIDASNGPASTAAVRLLLSLADVQMAQSRYAEADAVLRDALQRQQKHMPHHPDLLVIHNKLAAVQRFLGRYAESASLLQQAGDARIEPVANGPQDSRATPQWIALRRAQSRAQLAALQYAQQQYPQAEASYRASIEAYAATPVTDARSLLQARIWLAWSLLQQQRYSEAVPLLQAAIPQARQALGPNDRDTGRALWGLAMAQAALGDHAAADRQMREAIEAARHSGSLDLLATATHAYAQTLLKAGRRQEALTLYRQSIAAVDQLFVQTRGIDDASRESYIGRFNRFYQELVGLLAALHRQQPDAGYDREALAIVSTTQSRLFTEMLRQLDVKQLADDKAFQQLVQRQQEQKNRLAETRRARIELSGSGEDDADGSDRPMADPLIAERLAANRARLKAEQQAQEQALNEIESQLWAGYPRYMELTQPRPVTADMLQKQLLRGNETLISYYLLPQQVAIFVVEPGRFQLRLVPLARQELAQQIAALRRIEAETDGTAQSLARLDPALLHQLYRELFAPIEPLLQPGRKLLLVGDGPIHTLPLEMLISRWNSDDQRNFAEARQHAPHPLDEYASLPYLGQRYRFAYLPSLAALASLRLYRREPAGFEQELVSFADPAFDAPPDNASGKPAVRSIAGVSIPPLPETADEAREIAAIVGKRSEVYLHERAQEHTLKTLDLQHTRYLHFATHGLLGDEYLQLKQQVGQNGKAGNARVIDDGNGVTDTAALAQPALVLSLAGKLEGEDGLLTMSEIIESMHLNARLVVLSACNTAGESHGVSSGEGFAGLTRAFMYAGAQGLVVSHWSVDSAATQQMMTQMFRNMRNGSDSLNALQQARDQLRASHSAEQPGLAYAHPYFWAPFVYVGD